jgi:hypothetical protein
MAIKQIKLDDLTGEPIDDDIERTVFTYKDVEYELDLGADSALKLDEALAPFIRAAVASKPRQRVAPEVIRDWAQAQGFDISPRGRLSRTVLKAYDDAHGTPE